MDLTFNEIIYVVLGASALVYILLFVVLKVEKGGIRFTVADTPVIKKDEVTGELEANVTLERQDIVLKRGFKYVVGANNKIKEGKYTLLTTEEAINEFNIRRNGYVRSYEHNSNVILTEGDEITSINISVILR
jgi:hypothetical protein